METHARDLDGLGTDVEHLDLAEHGEMPDKAVDARSDVDVAEWRGVEEPARDKPVLEKVSPGISRGLAPFSEYGQIAAPCHGLRAWHIPERTTFTTVSEPIRHQGKQATWMHPYVSNQCSEHVFHVGWLPFIYVSGSQRAKRKY